MKDNVKPLYYCLGGILYSLFLLALGFMVIHESALFLSLAISPIVFGPLIWPVTFYLAADLKSSVRRRIFVALIAAHYVGLATSLLAAKEYEWHFDSLRFIFIVPQLAIYFLGQGILWVQFARQRR